MSKDTPEFLENALKFGIKLGLDRMNKLMDLLGNPQDGIRYVHIAGTNGKGSVVTCLSSILAAADLKVGIYTSPFLERFSERMRILDGRDDLIRFTQDDSTGEIDDESLNRNLELVKKASAQMVSEGYEDPTEFELVTAVCYLWFKEQNVDVAVLETGLGGRLDSTNIIKDPLCTLITAIGLDHTDRLGNTVTEISGEKAGIFKPGSKAILFDPKNMILEPSQQDEVMTVMTKKAEEVGADLSISRAAADDLKYLPDGRMSFCLKDRFDEEIVTTMIGGHQVFNIALAIDCAEYLRKYFDITDENILEGIRLSRWKGRVEILSSDPIVLLDGGHNPQGIKSLSDALTRICAGALKGKEMYLLMGVMKDKDVGNMLLTLEGSGVRFKKIYATTVNNPRSMEGSELCKQVKLVYNNQVEAYAFDDAKDAAKQAVSRALEDDAPLLVTGSLYLLGQVRGTVLKSLKEQSHE